MNHICRRLFLLQFCLLGVASARQERFEPTEYRIYVAKDVALHVLDWGGKGETVLFLSGLGASAYAFDEFAPMFADSYRTIGLTRRGIPPSDSSQSGYALKTLTDDIVAVMDSLRIPFAHIVGWSFGGNEAVSLAVGRPDRVRSVILLDSYDNSPEAGTFAGSDTLKTPRSPFTAFDSSSVFALMWRSRRMGARPLPVRAIRAGYRFSSDGRFLGPSVKVANLDSMIGGSHRLPYSSLTQPVLAFFNTTNGICDMSPRYPTLNDSDRVLVERMYDVGTQETALARARVRNEVPHVTVVEIAGASHAIFNSNPERVFLEMRRFLTKVRATRR